MNRVRLKVSAKWTGLLLAFLVLLSEVYQCRGIYIRRSNALSFETCAPYDSAFELNHIEIDTCTGNPCKIPIGQEVTISGRFNYTGSGLEKDIKLNHRPNWLLNYVYTAVTVLQNDNEVSSSENQVDFEAVVYVDESLAPLQGTLNWRLYNAEEERIACYNIPIQLTMC